MKNILIITTDFLPYLSPNANCLLEIIRPMMKKDYSFWVVCSGKKGEKSFEEIEGIKIYRIPKMLYQNLYDEADKSKFAVKEKIYYKLSTLLCHLKLAANIRNYPMTSGSLWKKYYRCVNNIEYKTEFDAYICTFNSLEALITGKQLKKKHPEKKMIYYLLDSLSNRGEGRWFNSKFGKDRGYIWERQLFPFADLILNPKCHEKHHLQEKYRSYYHKIKTIDFPLLNESKCEIGQEIKEGLCVYAGVVDTFYRNPKYVCEVFELLTGYSLEFYSKGNATVLIELFENNTNGRIRNCGYVAKDVLNGKMEQAEALISIGNDSSSMVPSKIFEYMNYRKPIIHFISSQKDSSISYLKDYPLALIIEMEKEKMQNNALKIKDYLEKNKGRNISFEELKVIYPLNFPEATIGLIEKEIYGDKKNGKT